MPKPGVCAAAGQYPASASAAALARPMTMVESFMVFPGSCKWPLDQITIAGRQQSGFRATVWQSHGLPLGPACGGGLLDLTLSVAILTKSTREPVRQQSS